MAGNIVLRIKFGDLGSGVGSPNFVSPKLLYYQPQLWNISLWSQREVSKVPLQVHSPGWTILSCVLANVFTLTWRVVVVLPSCGGGSFHTTHY